MNRIFPSLMRSSIFIALILILMSAYTLRLTAGSGSLHHFGIRIYRALAATPQDDPYSTDEDTTLVVPTPGVLNNDSPAGTVTAISVVTGPASGLLTGPEIDGSFTYDPDGQFEDLGTSETAIQTFTYTVTDDNGTSAEATVTITIDGVNDLPTISDISDKSTDEGTPVGPIGFTIGDAETPPASLEVAANSDNATLVPNDNITLGGAGANRTVTIAPAANQSGSAVITITDTDTNDESTSDSFTLIVNAVNALPTISDIADQSTDEDTPTAAIGFTIGDTETPAENLVVTASSDNTTLVPNDNISLGGAGENRTVSITPAANQNGSALITITVTDGDDESASDSFTLTVNSVNDLPTITDISDQSTTEDTPIGSIGFTIGDIETPVGSLVVSASSGNITLVPNGNIIFSGSGADRTISIEPAENQFGSALITVTVTDADGGSAEDSFTLTVSSVNDLPTITDIANQTTAEDTLIASIGFTIFDAETPLGSLIVTASSGNTTLVPNANIDIGGSGGSRTLTITPAANQFASSLITVTVADANGGSAFDTFTLTVTSINDPPTITNILNQTTPEDTPTGLIGFTIGDVETLPGNLDVAAISSNTTLVPNGNILIGGSGASRTLTITPVANQFGTTLITVSVTDEDDDSSSDNFILTVTSVNDLPTDITLSNSTIAENMDTGSLVGTLATTDIDSAGDPIYSLVIGTAYDSASFAIVGDELIASASFNFEAKDTYTIRIKTDDGNPGGTYEKDFTITIIDVNEAPVGLSDPYEVNLGESLNVTAPGVLGNDSDPDGDAITAVKMTDPTNGTLTFLTNGSFTYTPTGSFTGEDSFTYQVKDPAGLTSPSIQVLINVKDAASPSLIWIEPVNDGGQIDVNGEVILLKVEAIDDVSVDYVRFYRWDPNFPPNGSFVDIAIDEDPPFEVLINTSELNYEFNEIRARAYDDSGNFSFYKWIWLYRLLPTEFLFFPLVAGE